MNWPVDPHLFLAYVGVMAVMAVTPGPANVFSVATGAQRGRAAALAAVAGMNAATLVWFGAAALGLGALVAAFPQAFRLIAVAGAAYVAWLGLKALIDAARGAPPATAEDPESHAPTLGRSAVRDGFMVQIANPKAILFFTAVLPPFLDLTRPAGPQLAIFAAVTIVLDSLAMSAYGLGGAAIAERMRRPAFRRGFGIAVGCLLLLAAGLILLRL
jgi:threonine/homoserine/homoserine lactone efflux protein